MLDLRSGAVTKTLDRVARPGQSRFGDTPTLPNHRTADRWSTRFEVVGLVLVVISAGLFHVTARINQFLVANADNLLLAELFEDLASGGSIRDWYLPYSPYFVPDWPIYGLAALVTGQESLRLALFASLQFAALVTGVVSISRSLSGRAQWGATAAVGSAILFAAALEIKPFVFVAAPYIHFGTFAATVWLIAVTLRFVDDDRRWRWLVLSVVLATTLVASDRIVVAWFHVPAALAIAAWGWRENRRDAATWIGIHLITALATLPLPAVIGARESKYDLAFSLAPIGAAYRLWRSMVDATVDPGWWFWVGFLPLPIASWLLLRNRSLLGSTSFAPRPRAFLLVFLPLTVASTIAAQLLLGGSVAPGPRYSPTILVLPLLLLAGLLPPRRPSISHRAMLAVPVAAVLVWSSTALDDIDVGGPDHVACVGHQLARTGSTAGVASYWDARDLAVYLDEPDVDVAAYDLFGRPERINVSDARYRDRYDFVVQSERIPLWTLNLDRIQSINGAPLATVQCGEYTLLDYGPDGMTMNPFTQLGRSLTFDGCELATQVGRLSTDDCVLTSTGEAGFLTFGPYQPLPSGRYRAELTYRAAGSEPIGSWEASEFRRHGEIPLVVEERVLSGTGGHIATAVLDWTVDQHPSGELAVAEFRTIVDAARNVEVVSVKLTREPSG